VEIVNDQNTPFGFDRWHGGRARSLNLDIHSRLRQRQTNSKLAAFSRPIAFHVNAAAMRMDDFPG
jgi:hypothetical protein